MRSWQRGLEDVVVAHVPAAEDQAVERNASEGLRQTSGLGDHADARSNPRFIRATPAITGGGHGSTRADEADSQPAHSHSLGDQCRIVCAGCPAYEFSTMRGNFCCGLVRPMLP